MPYPEPVFSDLSFKELQGSPRTFSDLRMPFEQVRVKEVQAGIEKEYRSHLLDHGAKVASVHLVLHGLGNTTKDLLPLARELHASGENVLLPRAPFHGVSPQQAISALRTEDLLRFADLFAPLLPGLGERVRVTGISLGAGLAAYLSVTHPGIHEVNLVAPVFGIRGIPSCLGPFLKMMYTVRPDTKWWFKPSIPAPGRSTKAAAAAFGVSLEVLRRSARVPNSLPEVVRVISPDGDRLVCLKSLYRALAMLPETVTVTHLTMPAGIHNKNPDPQRVTAISPSSLEFLRNLLLNNGDPRR